MWGGYHQSPVGYVGVAIRGGFVCPAKHFEHVGWLPSIPGGLCWGGYKKRFRVACHAFGRVGWAALVVGGVGGGATRGEGGRRKETMRY
jgi:hypothetical protein